MTLRRWFLLPSRLWMAVLFAAPFAIVLAYSFLTRGVYGGIEPPWTAENYQRLFDPLYLTILLRSFAMALAATALCLVFAFPAALFISRAASRKNLYLQLVMLPFWTSFLVRTYAWIFLLRDTGLINTVLQQAGIIHGPLPLPYNGGAARFREASHPRGVVEPAPIRQLCESNHCGDGVACEGRKRGVEPTGGSGDSFIDQPNSSLCEPSRARRRVPTSGLR